MILLEAHGFSVADRKEIHGMQPSLAPLRFLRTLWKHGLGSVRDQTVRWSFVV